MMHRLYYAQLCLEMVTGKTRVNTVGSTSYSCEPCTKHCQQGRSKTRGRCVDAHKPTSERDEHLLDLIPSEREAIVFEDRS